MPRSYQKQERIRKKLLTKTSWYRPADAVCFVPATPGAELCQQVQQVVTEEAARLGMTVKVIETGGKSMKQTLVRMDLTGCIYPDCYLCESGEGGASHTRSGVQYSGTCNLCAEKGISAVYHGESGRSGYLRTKQHKADIQKGRTSNAFAKHLEIHHPDQIGNPSVFKFKSEQTFVKCLERQVSEGIAITNSSADTIMNSRSEYLQPAIHRVTTTREIRGGGS